MKISTLKKLSEDNVAPNMISFFVPQKNKKKILLRAPVLTQSGYGVHSRQIAKWLLSKNVDVEIQALRWGNTPWIMKGDSHDGMIEKIMRKSVDPTGRRYDATIQVQLPNEWDTKFSDVNIGITAGVETDICNSAWIKNIQMMNRVIVPSEFTHNTFVQTAKNCAIKIDNMHIIPEAITPDILSATSHNSPIVNFNCPTEKNLLVFGQITGNNPENDRKNLFYTIKWFCEVFAEQNVGLFVKTNLGTNTTLDRVNVEDVLQKIVGNVRRNNLPKIYMIHGDLSDVEVGGLYKDPKITGLVSLTRGEGFGLPLLEAAAVNLPIMATNYSGHIDFLKYTDFIPVSYNMQKIDASRVDNNIFMPNAMWASPDRNSAQKAMLSIIDRKKNCISENKVKNLFSEECIFKQYDEILKDILLC